MEQALLATEYAKQYLVQVSKLKDMPPDDKKLIKPHTSNGQLTLYSLPGNNVCVPTFPEDSEASAANVKFTHVMNNKTETWFMKSTMNQWIVSF